MMKLIHWLLRLSVVLGLLSSPGVGQTEKMQGDDKALAIVNKVSFQVQVRRSDREELVALKVDDKLYPGDRVICGENSYASLIFIDTAAELKLYPNTDLTLQGKRDAEGIVKRIFLPVGRLLTKVLKGKVEVVTPTAVASVKGTKWWTLVETASETRIIVLEGEVRVQHRETEESVVVSSGNSGVSSSDGSLVVVPTPEETVPEESINRVRGDLEIQFENDQGKRKTLHIEYEK